MKRLIFIIFFSGFYALNAQMPDVSLYNIKNEYVNIRELQGQELTLVDFWATWCKPCIIAIPELNKIYTDFKNEGISLIGVNIDSPRNQSKVRPFANARGMDYPVLLDPDQEMMKLMNVVVVPTLIIFNSSGEQVFSHEGFKPGDQQVLRDKINELLNDQ
jgi:peroxiredoxin